MAVGSYAFRYLQVGKQGTAVTPGSSVAATAILKPDGGTLNLNPNFKYHEQELEVADLAMYHGSELLSRGPYDMTFNGDATYEQIPYHLDAAIETGIITTPASGVLTRLWTYDPPFTARPDQRVFTFEAGDDLKNYDLDTAFCDGVELSFGLEAPVKVIAGYHAKTLTEVAKTGSLTVPTTETIISGKAKFYMDDTGALIAGATPTEITDVLISGTLRINSGLEAARRLNGSLDFATIGQNRRVMVAFNGVAEFNTASAAWLALMQANTKKFFMLAFTGSEIENPTPSFLKFLKIQWCGRFRGFTPWGQLAGTNTVPFTLNSEKDATWGKEAVVLLQNSVTALP